ncbi:methyltransferase domain-containing protein [Niabella hibiscisoli]|uniref:methyltransferase domain-containing protein n=1 Tax=Niabella hibiscisoli TaxID=1825928 RepID=UPI001F0F1D05|nr:methyltransferase domain-containing protein [Niabella hibiscisoli]MCH5717220.1 class I SAM-dependent methyltransferase [Niabella hibiscisoli]
MKISHAIITAISAFKHPEKRPTIGFARALKEKTGIEIGGPSAFFRQKSYYPIYLYAGRIDGVNFNASTVWEGEIEAGETYRYLEGYPKGKQYISEASELNDIANNQYDFLLSCHSLEHIANPAKALKRWYEVLKPGGKLVVIVPNKEATFDINRPYTTFQHLVDDYHNQVGETDSTHFEEVINLHSIEKDPGIEGKEELKKERQTIFITAVSIIIFFH